MRLTSCTNRASARQASKNFCAGLRIGAIEVKRMDNPALSSVRQEDFSEFIGGIAGELQPARGCRC